MPIHGRPAAARVCRSNSEQSMTFTLGFLLDITPLYLTIWIFQKGSLKMCPRVGSIDKKWPKLCGWDQHWPDPTHWSDGRSNCFWCKSQFRLVGRSRWCCLLLVWWKIQQCCSHKTTIVVKRTCRLIQSTKMIVATLIQAVNHSQKLFTFPMIPRQVPSSPLW